jgi:hypothetical protein
LGTLRAGYTTCITKCSGTPDDIYKGDASDLRRGVGYEHGDTVAGAGGV